RAAAAEIAPREQNRRTVIARMIKHEVRILRPLRIILSGLAAVEIAPCVEQVLAEARALDRLQELLRNDRVRVDVGAVERHDDSGVDAKRFHEWILLLRSGDEAPDI